MMHTKTIGILLCFMLVCCGTVSIAGMVDSSLDTVKTHIFILGRMEQLEFYGDSIDFEVLSIAFIKEGSEIHMLTKGDQVKFLSPMLGMLLGRTVFGFFGDWEYLT